MVIIAGGLGSRLGELTADRPKSMVEIRGKPFLQHQIELVRERGVERLVLCVGHLGGQIVDYFGGGRKFGVEISYSWDGDKLLGTGGALKRAEPLLDEAFLMMWGDSYLLLDYQEVWREFQDCALPGMMVVFRNDGFRAPSNVILEEGKVKVYDKRRSQEGMAWIDNGLSALKREVLDRILENESFAIEDIFGSLAEEDNLAAYETGQCFYEIGSREGIAELKLFLQQTIP